MTHHRLAAIWCIKFGDERMLARAADSRHLLALFALSIACCAFASCGKISGTSIVEFNDGFEAVLTGDGYDSIRIGWQKVNESSPKQLPKFYIRFPDGKVVCSTALSPEIMKSSSDLREAVWDEKGARNEAFSAAHTTFEFVDGRLLSVGVGNSRWGVGLAADGPFATFPGKVEDVERVFGPPISKRAVPNVAP